MKTYWAIMFPQIIIAIMYVGIFAASVYFVLTQDLSGWSEAQEKIAVYLLGALTAGLLQILNYFFSSSLGSKVKTISRGAN